MNTKHTNNGSLNSFKEFVLALLACEWGNIIRSVLVALDGLARSKGQGKQMGLDTSLATFDNLQALHARSLAGDETAFIQELALATILNVNVDESLRHNSNMYAPFVEKSIAWPVLYIPHGPSKEPLPIQRLRELGLGKAMEKGGASRRLLSSPLGFTALLLSAYRLLRSVKDGRAKSVLAQDMSNSTPPVKHWKQRLLPLLKESYPRLSSIPFLDVAALQRSRRNRVKKSAPEVSGDVAEELKQPYTTRLHKLYVSWLRLGGKPPSSK